MERASAVHYGATPVPAGGPPASGRLVEAFGEPCYVIEDVQALPPFLTTPVSVYRYKTFLPCRKYPSW